MARSILIETPWVPPRPHVTESPRYGRFCRRNVINRQIAAQRTGKVKEFIARHCAKPAAAQ
ncbi:hypothetical protein EON00_07960 [Burkholderia sp. ISTR5]|nr:hypothetical protein [Burkholderia sp. ISTR5]